MTYSNNKHLILACDGGGIRGLVTALLLQELSKTHADFLAQTYLHAGTSTGGIVSLGLACGLAPEQLVSLYQDDGSQIFTKSQCIAHNEVASLAAAVAQPPASAAGESWWEFILKYLSDIICPWYDNTGLKSLIEKTLGSSTSQTLNSLVPSTKNQFVLVNTLQLCDSKNVWTPLQLTNLKNITGNDSGETLVIDAAMSTSAAPMYFPPYNHPTYGYCADGGLFANNPGTIALTTLIESGVALQDIWMLSLSTGDTLNCYPASIINFNGASNFGLLSWLWPVSQPDPAVPNQPFTPNLPMMQAVFDGTSQIDAYQCSQLLQGRFKRANVPLTQPVDLDNYLPQAIKTLTDSTDCYIKKSTEWADIISWISKNFE